MQESFLVIAQPSPPKIKGARRAISLIRKYIRQSLSGSPAKSGQLDLATKNSFPLFFVSKKALVDIYEIYLF